MMLRSFTVSALLVAVAIGLPACANDGAGDVATAQSPGASASTPGGSPSGMPDARQFVACLRARGIDVDDPPPGGQVRLNSKDDRTRTALRACQRFAPPGVPEEEGTFDPAAARAYAACIRGKGFPDFPTPMRAGRRSRRT